MDLNTNAFRIVQSLTNENKEDRKTSEAASKAGKRGGRARAMALSDERRKEIAINAVRTRWKNRSGK